MAARQFTRRAHGRRACAARSVTASDAVFRRTRAICTQVLDVLATALLWPAYDSCHLRIGVKRARSIAPCLRDHSIGCLTSSTIIEEGSSIFSYP